MAWSWLVWVVCASLSLFRQFFTIARTRETLCHLIYLFPRRSSWDTVVCIHLVEEIMADLARFSALFIIFCSSPGILREPPFFARERETFGYLFCTCTPYGSWVSLTGEEERRKKKERRWRFSIFSKFVFSASIKLSGNQRTYLYSGGSGLSIDIHFVDIELSYDVLSPLLSKHFNHPHPYIEIATAISDIILLCIRRQPSRVSRTYPESTAWSNNKSLY